MLLAIEQGNTNTLFAVHDGTDWVAQWRTATDPQRTADEYAVWLSQLLTLAELKLAELSEEVHAPFLYSKWEFTIDTQTPLEMARSRKRKEIARMIEENPGHSAWYIDRFRTMAAEGSTKRWISGGWCWGCAAWASASPGRWGCWPTVIVRLPSAGIKKALDQDFSASPLAASCSRARLSRASALTRIRVSDRSWVSS